MIDLTIVEWGDLVGGGGFVPYHDPDRPPPGKPFQNAAELLVSEEVCQPPEGTRDSHRHPVWSLRCVKVHSLGSYWCFAVQGRGGAFGRAGSCQFAFAPAHVEPWQVWTTGVRLVGADGRLGYRPSNQAPGGAINERQISGVLTGLAERRPRIVVDGEPVDVAAAIARLLEVMPVEVIRAYVWITYLLRRPVLTEHPTVAGRWPAELAASSAATLVSQWLDTASGEPSTLQQRPRWPEAVTWLTERTVSGEGIDQSYRQLGGMTDLLDTIVDVELGFRLQDVPAQLDIDADRLQFGTGPDLVRQWARTEPREAIRRLHGRAGLSWLDELLLDELLEANVRAAAGENPALFPPADESPFPGWHARLAWLLRHRYAGQAAMADFVRRELMAADRPMADRVAVEQATPWLEEELGLSCYDTTGIFPVPTDRIVRELQEQGYLSPTHRRLLAGASDFAGEAGRVVDRLGYVPASTGIELLQVAAVDAHQDESVVGDLARHLLRHNDDHRGRRTPACGTWLQDVLDGDLPPRTRALLVDVGVNHLAQLGSKPLPAAFLRRMQKLQADEPGLPDATRRPLLLESPERPQAAVEHGLNPVPDVRPTEAGWDPSDSDNGFLSLLIALAFILVFGVALFLAVQFLLIRH